MIRRSTLIAAEILLGLIAALIIGVGLSWWRLSQGPVELGFLRETVKSELSEARSGRPVGIEDVVLSWSKEAGALELRAIGVTVEDGRGGVLSRSDEARIQLAVLPLLIGQIRVEQAEFRGGEISITHKIDGAIEVAFGPPGTPPDIIVPRSESNETLEQKVNRLLDGMEAAFKPVGPGGRLRSVAVRNARLTISDDKGGGRWTAEAAALVLARQGDALTLSADAALEGAQGQAPASLRITTDTAFQSAIVEFGARDVRPRALFSEAALGPFGALDAPFTATVSVGLDRKAGITRFEGEATLGRGNANTADGKFNLAGGRLHGRYDVDSDEVVIDQLALAGSTTSIRGEMHVRDASRIMSADPNQPAAFDITLPALTLDVPGTFSAPLVLSNVRANGTIVGAQRSINFASLKAQVEGAAVDATGRLYFAEVGAERKLYPGIQLDGTVTGTLGAPTVMHFWPIGMGENARHYVADAITGGRVTGGTAMLDIRPADFANADNGFRTEAIDVRFNVIDGVFRFIDTMSPITNARGIGVLRGNSFDLNIPEARINGLAVTGGRVEIPRLKPRGGMTTISARAEGEARNILELLMQEPLKLGDRLPVDSATATGRGAVNIRLQRPNLENVAFEDWRFTVDGQVRNFAGNMTTRRVALTNGQLTVRGDQRAINISGPIRAGGSNVEVRWTEYLNRPTQASSEYQIAGDFDADDLERLGYPVAQYAQGRVGVTVSGAGRGFDVDQAHIELDLRNAAVEAPRHFWTKRAGQVASAQFDVARQRDGTLLFSNIDARGAGLVTQGTVRMTRDERIAEANLTRLSVEGRTDARLVATRAADGGTDIAITGPLFDAAPFMDSDTPPAPVQATPASAQADPPLRATVNVDHLKLRGGATLENARVELSIIRGSLTTLIAEGRSPSDKAFSLALGPRPSDPAGHVRFRSDDAGFAVRALTGAENIVGGTATAEGDWRPTPTQARFNIRMRDFQVVRLPAMARLLSASGSLTGLVEMLNGDGIGFSALDTQMVYTNDRVSFADGRMAGPSLGLTGSGAYDIHRDNLDIDGVVAPSPGLNSMLGNVPLVGELFVSRRGEGVVGVTYSINGPVAEPRVGVNPLSALTPGILRRIFEPAPPRGGTRASREAADLPKPADTPPPPETPTVQQNAAPAPEAEAGASTEPTSLPAVEAATAP